MTNSPSENSVSNRCHNNMCHETYNLLSSCFFHIFLGRKMTAIKHHNRLDVLGQEIVDELHTIIYIPTKHKL